MSFKQVFAEGALGVVSGVVTSLSTGAKLGDFRIDTAGNEYQLFYNACGQTIAKGKIFARNVGSAAGAGPYSVTVTTVAEAGFNTAGAVYHADVPTATYFWGVVRSGKDGIPMIINTAVATLGAYIKPAADGALTNGTTGAVGYMMATNVTGTLGGTFHVDFLRQLSQ